MEMKVHRFIWDGDNHDSILYSGKTQETITDTLLPTQA